MDSHLNIDVHEIEVTQPYALIREWWGEDLSPALAKRIRSAPRLHLEEFVEFALAAPRKKLPQLEPGQARPLPKIVNSRRKNDSSLVNYFDSALVLLLYSDEVAVEDPIPHLRFPCN